MVFLVTFWLVFDFIDYGYYISFLIHIQHLLSSFFIKYNDTNIRCQTSFVKYFFLKKNYIFFVFGK